jgi:HEAT repeat protein
MLTKLQNDPDKRVSLAVAKGLSRVLDTSRPDFPPQAITALAELATSSDNTIRVMAVDTLTKAMSDNPSTTARPEVGAALVALLGTGYPDLRRSVMQALQQGVAVNSALATPAMASALRPLLKDKDTAVRSYATRAFIRAVEVNPALATNELTEALQALLQAPEGDIRSSATALLGQIYANQVLQGGADDPLFDRLGDRLNRLERTIAARALFLIVLNDTGDLAHSHAIRARLGSLADSPEPIIHIWANRTLKLLELADLARSASTLEAIQRTPIQSLLQISSSSYYSKFFGEDFNWAAERATSWLRQQEDRERADQGVK